MRSPESLVAALTDLLPLAGDRPAAVRVVQAPGRVNLIGDHTDYNGGFVLPAAIDLGTSIAFVPTDDRRVELTNTDTGETIAFELDDVGPPVGTWRDYVAGTAWALAEAGEEPRGLRGLLAADLPVGTGLSSSAALELAAAWALCAGSVPLGDRLETARVAQRAENDYVGVACGIMDQATVALGEPGCALLLDCRALAHRAVPIPEDVALVICDTGRPRRLLGSPYMQRRVECERALAGLRAVDPAIRSLRDAKESHLLATRHRLDEIAWRRARHVVSENARVVACAAALDVGDLAAVGELLAASHASLRDDFGVSTPELDHAVDVALRTPGVIGARLTGAGFGGATINLVLADAVARLTAALEREAAGPGSQVQVRQVVASVGATRVR